MIDFLHMFAMLPDAKMRSGLWPFFHLAMLKDFCSLASWMSVRSHDSAQCCCCCFLPTPMTLASGGEFDVPACGPPSSFSVHLASSAVCGNVCCVAAVVKKNIFQPWSVEVCCVFVYGV